MYNVMKCKGMLKFRVVGDTQLKSLPFGRVR